MAAAAVFLPRTSTAQVNTGDSRSMNNMENNANSGSNVQFDIAKKGAFPELTRMREEGLIKGWGIGVNTPERLHEKRDN